jgi:hypothetical protein
MMKEPEFKKLHLRDFFEKASYSIPIYQREYAWTHDEIEALLTDLLEFNSGDEPFYLMGQIVVVPSIAGDRDFDLVDGQQRITSLFLLYLALKEQFAEFEPAENDSRAYKRAKVVLESIMIIDDEKERGGKPRLKTAAESEDFLLRIIDQQPTPIDPKSVTEKNLKANYQEIETFVKEQLTDAQKLLSFYDRISHSVWFLRLEVDSNEQALEIFEKMNDRGLALNSADLLKNLLFQNTSQSEYSILAEAWEFSATEVFSIKKKRVASMEFLLKALVASQTGESVPFKRVFRRWRTEFKDDPTLIGKFDSLLTSKATVLKRLASRETPQGNDSPELVATSFAGSIQQFTVLLAASNLEDIQFRLLARIADTRTFLSLLSKELPQDFEVILPKWANRVSRLSPIATAEEIYEASEIALVGLDSLFERARQQMMRLSYTKKLERDRIRFILATTTRCVEARAHRNVSDFWDRALVGNKKVTNAKAFDIEHVMPQDAKYTSLAGDDDTDWIDSIGNLVLMDYQDNRGAGNKAPQDKLDHYASSELLLTRSLCDIDDLGQLNPRLRRALEELSGKASLATWNRTAVEARGELYWEILAEELSEALRFDRGN